MLVCVTQRGSPCFYLAPMAVVIIDLIVLNIVSFVSDGLLYITHVPNNIGFVCTIRMVNLSEISLQLATWHCSH